MTDHAAWARKAIAFQDVFGRLNKDETETLVMFLAYYGRAVEAEALEKAADDAAIEGLGQAITGWLRTRAGAIRAVKDK